MIPLTRPRPVLTSAAITGLITSIAGVLTFLGYDNASAHLSTQATTLTSVILGVVLLGSHLAAALHSQNKVTPLVSPQSAEGVPLVPVKP